MSTITVSTTDQLLSAVGAAKSGDTILLAAGSYTGVLIMNVNFAGTVHIASADPDHPAVLGSFEVRDSSGLSFSNLEFDANAADFSNLTATQIADPYPFRVTRSDRVTFDNLNVHGSLDNNPWNDRTGLEFSNSTNYSVTNSEFHDLGNGIITSLGDHATFSNNYFHVLESDAIHGSTSYETVTNNYFTDFFPMSGSHPDTVQFFDEYGIAPHDIVVSGNAFYRGSGSAAQGTFLRVDDASPVKFANVTVTDNFYAGAMYSAVTVLGANGVNINHNVIVPFADYDSYVWIGNSSAISETNNSAAWFIYGLVGATNFTPTTGNTNISVSGNLTSATVTDGGAAAFATWLAAHPNSYANVVIGTGTTSTGGTTGGSTGGTTGGSTGGATGGATTTPPPPPTGIILDPSSDTGVVGDTITKSAIVRIDGKVSEGGSTITLLSDGAVVGSAVADSTGAFNVASSTLADGKHALQAVAKSAGGITSTASDALNVTVDTHAPISDLIDFSLARGSKSETVTLSGHATDDSAGGVSVGIYRDGALIKTVSDTGGGWSLSDTTTTSAHSYTVKATDVAGNVSSNGGSLVVGSAGNDSLKGTTGDDYIWSAGGYDSMTGGGGNDTFVFRSASDAPLASFNKGGKMTSVEQIGDFGAGDKIDLTGVGHLVFDGQSSTAHSRAVDWYVTGGNTYVIADVNGDGRADMTIQLAGVHQLTANDFLLG